MRLQARRARDDLAVSRVLGAGHPLSAASAQRLGQYQLLGVPAVSGLRVLDRLQPEAAGTSPRLADLGRGQPRLSTQIPVRHGVPLLMDTAHQGR
jgi:hypothetical protein